MYRRVSAGVLATALLLVSSPVYATCEDLGDLLYCGDVTGDCKVTASDSLLALRMAVDQIAEEAEADMDGSGAVTATDSLAILRIAVGSLAQSYGCDEGQIVLTASSSGFYSPTGSHSPGNYAVGWYANSQPP